MRNVWRKAWIASALIALVALGVACASDDGDEASENDGTPSVQPIEEILDGEIEIADLTSTSASVRVDTTLDVACAVVYGATPEYGSIATDLDMAGGGHRVHNAPLRGLEPDTLYHYRLQGSGPDGTLYMSESMTFRTPPASAEDDRGPNLAGLDAGASIADVSSVFGDSPDWAAEHAIDGDPATEWSSAGDGDEASLTVTLPDQTTITSVGIWTRTMGSTAQITSFQVTADGEAVLGPFEVPDAAGMHVFDLPEPVEAETLRFEVVSSSGGNTGLVEFAAYGE